MIAAAGVAALVFPACGDSADQPVATRPDAVATCDMTFVPADEVTVMGDLEPDEEDMVRWALGRFGAADLALPSVIEFGFDATQARCDGARGLCLSRDDPPQAIVCEPGGHTAYRVVNRRVTLLHELAHLWFVGGFAPQAQEIVGGEIVGGEAGRDSDVPWHLRTTERVATVISWGLMDQLRRPVASDLPCVDLHQQFTALTGRAPLGPLEAICIPDTGSP